MREVIISFVQNIVNPLISLVFNIKTLEGYKTIIWGTHTALPIGSFIEALFNFIILSFTIFIIIEISDKSKLLIEKKDSEEVITLKENNKNQEEIIKLQQKQVELLEKLLKQNVNSQAEDN